MEIYWSAVARLRNNPDATVEDTIPIRLLVKRINTEVILPNMPPAVIAPPKHMAQTISQMVFIIPDIPRVATNSFISALPVSSWVPPKSMPMPPLKSAVRPATPCPAISRNKSGWNISAKTVASVVEINKVMTEGTLRAIKTPVTTGTIISHQEILNLESSACMYSVI